MSFYIGRYKGLHKETYKMEVITPMFLGGANVKDADLRIPSFKGILRFWWRAISGINNLGELKIKESEIFGSTEEKSKLSMDILNAQIKTSKKLFKGDKFMGESKGKKFPLDILHYLAFGAVIYDRNIKGNKVDKEYIDVKSSFELKLTAPDKHFQEAEKALKYFISFGNIGAKLRNGFGSIFSPDIEPESNISFQNDFLDYTSFSKFSKIIKFQEENSWQNALSDVGLAYREARLSIENRHQFDKRGLVAKPIEAQNEPIPAYIRNGRHSKPYFLKVNKLKNGKFQGQIIFLPYKYHNFNQRNEYLATLNKMNQEIEKLSGGNKWQ